MNEPNPQIAPAMALVQLLTEHPNLPAANWSVDAYNGSLHGHLHVESFGALNAYVRLMGGSVRASKRTRLAGDHEVRTHWLSTRWRDVPVEVAIALPVPASLPCPGDGQLAEQAHQANDPAVPAPAFGVAA